MSDEMTRKSAAQILFDRIMRTWVVPEVERRKLESAINLQMALIEFSDDGSTKVSLNNEVLGLVEHMEVVTTRAMAAGDPVLIEDIGGIQKIRTSSALWGKTCLFIVQGVGGKYFARASRLRLLPGSAEFKRAGERLAKEGVLLASGQSQMPIAMDLIRNSYIGPPTRKRAFVLDLKARMVERVRREGMRRIRRHLKLPTYMIHHDDDAVPLLLETRQAYIDGLFFSAIASATTTADRICNGLLCRYHVPIAKIRQLLALTFGQKIEQLRAMDLVLDSEEGVLRQLNDLRNRHLHPKSNCTTRKLGRDAFRAIVLLHSFFEQTTSIFRDYTIENGIFVPRPLV